MIQLRQELYDQLAAARIDEKEAVAEAESSLVEHDKEERIGAQILRAAAIAKRRAILRLNNGESVLYQTGWASVFFDIEQDLAIQAQLYGVRSIKRRFPLATSLSNTQLYLRPSSLDGLVHTDSYDYAALFRETERGIFVPPEDGELPEDKDPVLPDTPKWRELDIILGQLSIAEFSRSVY